MMLVFAVACCCCRVFLFVDCWLLLLVVVAVGVERCLSVLCCGRCCLFS